MPPATPRHSLYWRKTLRLSAVLLLVWFVVSLAVGLFGRSLDFGLFGWPLGLWATAQGALVVYCGIVWYYAFVMDRLDREHGDEASD